MDWVRLHLVTNHFPTILIVAGALAAIAAFVSKRSGIWQYAFVTVLLAGLTSPVAYVTGLQAEEIVEEAWYADHATIEEHGESGLFALIGLLAAGAAAAVAWWKGNRATRGFFAVVTLVAAALTGYAALEGGEIVHDNATLEQRPIGPTAGTTPGAEPAAARESARE